MGPHGLQIAPKPDALIMLGEFGLVLMVLEAGVEVDLQQLAHVGQRGVAVAFAGSLAPLAIGATLGHLVFGMNVMSSLAVGASLAPTSMGISLKVLQDGGVLGTPTGQLIIAAAVLDDVIALVLLSELEALKHPSTVDFIIPIVSSACFIVVVGYCAVRVVPDVLVRRVVPRVAKENVEGLLLGLVFVVAYALMVVLHYGRSSHLLGAFLGGLCFCSLSSMQHTWHVKVEKILSWLVRVFFACTIGFEVPIRDLWTGPVLARGGVPRRRPGQNRHGAFRETADPRRGDEDRFRHECVGRVRVHRRHRVSRGWDHVFRGLLRRHPRRAPEYRLLPLRREIRHRARQGEHHQARRPRVHRANGRRRGGLTLGVRHGPRRRDRRHASRVLRLRGGGSEPMGSVRRRLQSHEGRLRGYGGVGRVHQTQSWVGFVRAVLRDPKLRAPLDASLSCAENREVETRIGAVQTALESLLLHPEGVLQVSEREGEVLLARWVPDLEPEDAEDTADDKAMRQADDLLRGSGGAGPAAGASFDGVFPSPDARNKPPPGIPPSFLRRRPAHARLLRSETHKHVFRTRSLVDLLDDFPEYRTPQDEKLHSAFVDGAMRRPRRSRARMGMGAMRQYREAAEGMRAALATSDVGRSRQSGTHPRARRRRRRRRDPLRRRRRATGDGTSRAPQSRVDRGVEGAGARAEDDVERRGRVVARSILGV